MSRAVRVALGAAVTTTLLLPSTAVFAQTATGSIYGSADPGTVISIKSQATGLARDITVGSSGKFTFAALPTGIYTVTENKPGANARDVAVSPGQGSAVDFEEALQEVVVTGSSISRIDTSTAQVATVYTATLLDELPVGRDLTSIALLAPGAVRGTASAGANASDAASYASLPSIGGSGVSENTYYINGFNVTNLFANLSYANLPYEAIESEQVITGGYGPEYGLATGGVISLQTKKGTNEWKVGGSATFDPNAVRGIEGPATYTSDGTPYVDFSKNTDSTARYDLWGGGAIIPDHLFIYMVGEFQHENANVYPNSYYQSDNVTSTSTKSPFGLVNIDWQINDRNLIELTGIENQNTIAQGNFSAGTDPNTGFVDKDTFAGTDYKHQGGWIGIAKYTGNITDDLTLTAQYGQLHNKREEYQIAANGQRISYDGTIGNFNQPGCPFVSYQPSWTKLNPGAPTPSCYVTEDLDSADGLDTRKAGRADLSYKLNLPIPFVATQTFAIGYDFDRWTSASGESRSGGAGITYYDQACPTDPSHCNITAADPYTGPYYRQTEFQTGANAALHSGSYYIKDDIQITKNFLLQLGVRNDGFKNINGANEIYASEANIWQPRVGFAWDLKGDASSKLYGSYGIYSNPITAGVAIRGASASYYCYQYYTYTAIDPLTGRPTQGAPLADGNFCYNGETGETPAAGTFAATNLSPTKQDEVILGFQQSLGDGWTAGIRGTYRNLEKTIDDYCSLGAFYNWIARTGYTGSTAGLDAALANDNQGCLLINPGYGANVRYDLAGTGTLNSIALTPGDLDLPKAKRRYVGVDLTLEKAWNRQWYTQLSYTWSHNYGNTEGTSDSDNSQTDIGTTELFDYPQIMEGAFGDLPNDHRNTFKALGAYKFLSDFTVSANALLQTGKPINCIGDDPAADAAPYSGAYGDVYHFCNGVIVPRGSVGRTPELFNLDMALAYTPSVVPGLSAMVSVFNLFNTHTVTGVDETATSGGAPVSSYLAPFAYQSPRYLELTVRYQFNFTQGHGQQ